MTTDFSNPRERDAYIRGLKNGLARFAWSKDGEQYVGTCGYTLKEAMADVDKEFGVLTSDSMSRPAYIRTA